MNKSENDYDLNAVLYIIQIKIYKNKPNLLLYLCKAAVLERNMIQQHEIPLAELNEQRVQDYLRDYKAQVERAVEAYENLSAYHDLIRALLIGSNWVFKISSALVVLLSMGFIAVFMEFLIFGLTFALLSIIELSFLMLMTGLLLLSVGVVGLGFSIGLIKLMEWCFNRLDDRLFPRTREQIAERLRVLIEENLFIQIKNNNHYSQQFEQALMEQFFSESLGEDSRSLLPRILGAYLISVRLDRQITQANPVAIPGNQQRAHRLILSAVAACINTSEAGSKKHLDQLGRLLDFTLQYPYVDKTVRRELAVSYLSAISLTVKEAHRAQFMCGLFRRMEHFSLLLPLLRDQTTPNGWNYFEQGDFKAFSAEILLSVSDRLSHKGITRQLNGKSVKPLSQKMFKAGAPLFGVVLKSLEALDHRQAKDETLFSYIYSVLVSNREMNINSVLEACETFSDEFRGTQGFMADCLEYIRMQQFPELYHQCLETPAGKRCLENQPLHREVIGLGTFARQDLVQLNREAFLLKNHDVNFSLKEKLAELDQKFPVGTELEAGFDQTLSKVFQKSDNPESLDPDEIGRFLSSMLNSNHQSYFFRKLSIEDQTLLKRSVSVVLQWAKQWAWEKQGLRSEEEISASVQEFFKEIHIKVEQQTYDQRPLKTVYKQLGIELDELEVDFRFQPCEVLAQ